MLQGIRAHVTKANSDFLKTFGAEFFRTIQQSGALATLDVLRQTYAAGLTQQFREVVEKSGDDKQLAIEITLIVEKELKEPGASAFVTREKLTIIITILGLLAA